MAPSRWLAGRPRRSGTARRAQASRAHSRAVQLLLRGFREVRQHRGCQASVLGSALETALLALGQEALPKEEIAVDVYEDKKDSNTTPVLPDTLSPVTLHHAPPTVPDPAEKRQKVEGEFSSLIPRFRRWSKTSLVDVV